MKITWSVIKKFCAFISAVLPAILIVHTTMTASLLSGCAIVSKDSTVQAAGETEAERLENKWGVQIESLRMSAADNLVDFRYRIIDPDKALPLVERKNKPYLIDQGSGKTLGVPSGAKVGPLRQTEKYGKPKENRVYFVLFGNPGGLVKPGNKVTVVIGDFRVEDLVVE